MIDAGWATENVIEATPEEIDALRELMPPTRPAWRNATTTTYEDGGWVWKPVAETECE